MASDDELLHAERVLIGNMLVGASEKVWSSGVTPMMFAPGPRQTIAAICHEMFLRGDKIEAGSVQSALMDAGMGSLSPELLACSDSFWPGTVTEPFSKALRDAEERRALRRAFTRGLQMLDSEEEPDLAKQLVLEDIGRAPSEATMGVLSLDEVLSMEDIHERWVIPGVMARRDRLMLTGNEGSGKSVMLAQLALGAAYGVHPFTEELIEPQRVLVLDVENDHEAQLSRIWRTVSAAYRVLRRDNPVEPVLHLVRSKDIDLLNPLEAGEFVRTAVFHQPDLVIMGSLYKMASSGEEHERFARTVQGVVDRMRSRTGAAVVIEAHAGHGFQGNRNSGRPDGSSLWLRWPELGIWMKPHPDGRPKRIHQMFRWRGDRVVRSAIPYGIEMGGSGLPWRSIDEGEWDARGL